MRRRVNFQKKGSKTTTKTKVPVTLNRPDIRTLWILFLLSFLRSSTGGVQPAILQSAALSLGRGFLPSILKGLANDPPQVVVYILMALHNGLLSDEASHKLSRSKVAGFFSEFACKELVALYDREGEMIEVANTEERHSVADVIHHFMLALCTHPGRGVCFIDQGWYGRKQTRGEAENEDEEEGEEGRGNSTSNNGVYNRFSLAYSNHSLPLVLQNKQN
jgi:nucleolar pre-ribosomal-associated protein 1